MNRLKSSLLHSEAFFTIVKLKEIFFSSNVHLEYLKHILD